MRILLDTNIVLDVLLNRSPWVQQAAQIWSMCSQGHLQGYVCASSFTDIFYIARRLTTLTRARAAIRICLETFTVCPVDRNTLDVADAMSGSDFEDNLIMVCAELNDIEAIITRDPGDFKISPVRAMAADEFLQWLATNDNNSI